MSVTKLHVVEGDGREDGTPERTLLDAARVGDKYVEAVVVGVMPDGTLDISHSVMTQPDLFVLLHRASRKVLYALDNED